jgi:HK97 family phage major capsid protein
MMNKAELKTFLQEIVGEEIAPVVKGFEDRVAELEAVKPAAIHTPETGLKDDGFMEQVGDASYRLSGGSIINPNRNWNSFGKGFSRSFGMFEKLGEETEVFFKAMKNSLLEGKNFKVATKALDISDVIRTTDDSSAGLFVPDDVRYALLQFAPPGTIVWPRAQVWPMTTNNIQWPKLVQDLSVAGSEDFFGNVVMTWTEEGASKTNTRPQFGSLALDCHELSAYTEITDVMIEDSAINLGNVLIQLFQGAYWHYTDMVFLNGMGGTRPLGVLNDPNINSVDRLYAGNMSSKMPAMFDANAVWFMKKEVFNSLRKEVDDLGRPVIELGQGYNNFGEGIAGYIIGYPVVISDYKTAALGSTGDVVLGDWKHYFIGERNSVKMEMSRHVAFRENRTAFRAAARLGGIPEEPLAFVVLNSSADFANMS